MSEVLLITRADIEEFWSISQNMDDSRVLPLVRQAQQSDLKPFLGEAFYYDLITNLQDSKYQELFNGGEYEYRGQTIYFGGLRQLICAWSYSRIYKANPDHVTRGGNVRKETEESEPQIQTITERRTNEAASEAIRLQAEAFRFLDQNRSDYSLWRNTYDSETPQRVSFRITKVQARSTVQSRGVDDTAEGNLNTRANKIRYGDGY